MSGIKPANLSDFYRSLHGRGQTITDLAEALNCGRSHLSQVLSGKRTGLPTWRKIQDAELLTDHELRLLGKLIGHDVPRGTFSHVEHEDQSLTAHAPISP